MNRLTALMVVMGVCVMAIPLTIARSAAGDATGLQEELDKLKGNWELASSSVVPEGKLKRVTKPNKRDKETVTRYDDAGNVTGAHLVDVMLSRVGKVTIFTYSNMKPACHRRFLSGYGQLTAHKGTAIFTSLEKW